MSNNDFALIFARLNNILMKGSFQGDDIHEVSFLMKTCTEFYNNLKEEEVNEKEDNN